MTKTPRIYVEDLGAVLPARDTTVTYQQGRWVTVMLRTVHGHHLVLVSVGAAPTTDAQDATIVDAWADATPARALYDETVRKQTSGTVGDQPAAGWYAHAGALHAARSRRR